MEAHHADQQKPTPISTTRGATWFKMWTGSIALALATCLQMPSNAFLFIRCCEVPCFISSLTHFTHTWRALAFCRHAWRRGRSCCSRSLATSDRTPQDCHSIARCSCGLSLRTRFRGTAEYGSVSRAQCFAYQRRQPVRVV